MKIKHLILEYFRDPFSRTLFLLAVIIGTVILFISLADHFNLFGKQIGAALYNSLHP